MSHLGHITPSVLDLISNDLSNMNILDVACGEGSWGFQLRLKKKGQPNIIGLDVWKPYLSELKNTGLYSTLICADIKHLPFKESVFDYSLVCEVVEHLTVPDAQATLKEVNTVTSGRVIVTTPNGFLKQHEVDNNKFQIHLSGWSPDMFSQLRFKHKISSDFLLPNRVKKLFSKCVRVVPSFLKFQEIVAWKDNS